MYVALIAALVACHGGGDTTDTDTDVANTDPTSALADAPTIVRGNPGVGAGFSVAIGDVDGDHVADLVSGAPYANHACAGWPAGATTGYGDADACFAGAHAGDFAGYAVLAGHDLDGEGVDDLVVGAIGADGGGTDHGRAYVVRGPVAEGSLADAWASYTGAGDLDNAGTSLAIGDLNADGTPDLVVGAPGAAAGGTGGGVAYVVFGPLTAGDHDLGAANAAIQGTGTTLRHGSYGNGDALGTSIAVVGDVDGDGVDDLFLGAGGNDLGATDAGLAGLILGPIGAGHFGIGAADALILGDTPGGFAGEPVARPGDVDGDGHADLLLSANAAVPERAWLFTGNPAGTLHVTEDATTEFVSDDDDGLGWAMAGGDVNGDGVSDVVFGVPWSDRTANDAGGALLVLGPIPTGSVDLHGAAWMWRGEVTQDAAGTALAIGDVGDDGAIDIVIGAPYAATGGGSAYVVGFTP